MQKGFLTVQEVAKLLRVHPTTIYNIIKRRELPAMRVGKSYRVYKEDFEQYLKDNYERPDS